MAMGVDTVLVDFTSQILERVKSDHVTITKPDEDRRRRTIILERRDGSYGFTLQSYGIHYKKEQEIEMITYVDHVDYDGPAFRAGMREGDVILSINGHDMEKVDHKSLVNFIKGCLHRMRMVVLFEDCVRKVELHMRYIQIQRALQMKADELEKLCLREKELLKGKWKTHSLPARKKNGSGKSVKQSNVPADDVDGGEQDLISRSAVSTEDVAAGNGGHHHRQNNHYLIAYQNQPYYVDSKGRTYYIQPTHASSSSREFLVSVNGKWALPQRSNSHCCNSNNYSNNKEKSRKSSSSSSNNIEEKSNHQKRSNSMNLSNNYANGESRNAGSNGKNEKRRITRSRSYHQHICGACIAASRGSCSPPQENNSLDVYDLASSPCCNSQCIPRRRRSHSQHQHKLKSSSSKTSLQTQNSVSATKELSESFSNRSTQVNIPGGGFLRNGLHRRHSKYSNNKGPYENLNSDYSLYSCSSEIGGQNTIASNSTCFSTDTLYWGDQTNSLQPPTRKNSVKSERQQNSSSSVVKPVKSWDSLTAKIVTNGGTAYDYLDKHPSSRSNSSRNIYLMKKDSSKYGKTIKSSESLVFYSPNVSETSLKNSEKSIRIVANEQSALNQRDQASQTDSTKRIVNIQQTPEVTRL